MTIRNKSQLLLAALIPCASLFAGTTAEAASSLTASITQTPSLGKVSAAANSNTTNFPVGTDGSKGAPSGGGSWVSGAVRAAIVTLTCAAGAKCQSSAVTITISGPSPAAGTGRGAGTNPFSFVATATPASGTVNAGPANTLTLKLPSGIGPKGKTSTAVAVKIGAAFPVLGDGVSSSSSGGWTINVSATDGTNSTGTIPVTGGATVEHGISVTATDLDFGKIASSAIGGTVDYPAGTGVMTVPSDTKSLGSPHLGSITVTGEANAFVSASVSTQPLNGPSGSLSWSPTISPGGAQMLSPTSGAAGSATYSIGGSFTLPAGATPGTYSGSYTATVQYN